MADSITWNQISGNLFMIQLHYLNLLYFLFMVKPFSICISRQSAVYLSRGKKQNMLDLGPLHQKVSTHIQAIIANPFNLLCENPSSDIASLEGDEWQHPDIFKSIKDLNLPCLEGLLVAFFTGADETWTHFTSEFAPGDLIDAATTEWDLAWMPATNDENEGALGSFCKLI